MPGQKNFVVLGQDANKLHLDVAEKAKAEHQKKIPQTCLLAGCFGLQINAVLVVVEIAVLGNGVAIVRFNMELDFVFSAPF